MTPRLGFVGLGWIGLARLRAAAPHADVAALCDPRPEALRAAAALAPEAHLVADLGEALALELDGVVIATPSSLHAAQCAAALDRAVPVFCQKPLGCSADEVAAVLAAARRADRLLGVDLSYRGTAALREMRAALPSIGRVYAADLTFHNAYGPRDRAAVGGGCLLDLGIHLVDALLWVLGSPPVEAVHGARWSRGVRITSGQEDHAVATITLADGATARLACSWGLPAGRGAEIGVDLWGTQGALRLSNVEGSFFDFELAACRGAEREVRVSPPDDWSGRQLLAWIERLSADASYDPAVEDQLRVAQILDAAAR